jgi:uncharacterized C2H2 Zn-finger protein
MGEPGKGETLLRCRECGGAVTWDGKGYHRACGHEKATIVAEMKAHATGVSRLEPPKA